MEAEPKMRWIIAGDEDSQPKLVPEDQAPAGAMTLLEARDLQPLQGTTVLRANGESAQVEE